VKKFLAMVLATLTAATVLVGIATTAPSSSGDSAEALAGSSFQAGNIVSDANFYDGDALSAAQIQSFLASQVSACSSSSCLVNGRFSLDSRAADAMCAAMSGGSSLSTAEIIARVGAACGISPKVILVTLQKEQSLVTAKNPSAATLERAMGYACPDTANGGCDPAYAGVGNQIYWSAWQWKRYGNPAGTSKYFTWFAPGAAHAIQYNPTVSCGTKTVTVQNAATAALYYYTPYTPNTAALTNLYGTGDSCSAYGNRNFWRLWSDWFGSPTDASTTAFGTIDGVEGAYDSVRVHGWAMDQYSTASTKVEVTIDGTTTTLTADQTRTDVGRAYPGKGDHHGYDSTVAAQPGARTVCVAAVSSNGATRENLGCRDVTVASGSPFGSLDLVQAGPSGVSVGGWAIDPETTAPIDVIVTSDGAQVARFAASAVRTDVGRAYPASGSVHGFSTAVAMPFGDHRVCVTGVNIGKGGNATIGTCKTVTVAGSTPIGSLDVASTTRTSITVGGWALDGDTTGAVPVDVVIDGVATRITADHSRTDIGRIYPAYGSLHGYNATIRAAAGTHTVCVRGVNTGAGSASPQLGCKTVTVTNRAPIGSLDVVTALQGKVTVGGWAIDPDTTASIPVHLYVGSVGRAITATATRTDVGRAYPGSGDQHGFAATVPAASGLQQVCAYGIDSDGGDNTLLGCKVVRVP